MKSIRIYILMLGILMALVGCQTDFVKPLENDSEAPAPVLLLLMSSNKKEIKSRKQANSKGKGKRAVRRKGR